MLRKGFNRGLSPIVLPIVLLFPSVFPSVKKASLEPVALNASKPPRFK